MPSPSGDALPLRLIVEDPHPDFVLTLQHGKDGMEPPTAASPTEVVFDFAVRLGRPQADGSPNFLGPHTQGPPATRFVYVCVRRRAGPGMSVAHGRMKVPLTAIAAAQVKALLATPGRRLAVRVPGRNPKGAPTLATVRLPSDPWKLVADRPG